MKYQQKLLTLCKILSMDYLMYISAIVLLIIGFIGDVIPGIPGTPVSYLALLLVHWSDRYSYSTKFLVIAGLICAVITVLDYVVPVWGTKKFGGTKAGVRGSTIGLILGLLLSFFTGPLAIFCILGGPFLGAYIGEKNGGSSDEHALRSAFGSFIGFLAGTFMKIVYTVVIGFYVVRAIIEVAVNQ